VTAPGTHPLADATAATAPPEGAATSRSWRIEFPARQKLLNANQRLHFRQKAAITRQLRGDAFFLARKAKVPPLERARIDCIYEPPDRRRRDAANWADSAKPCVDGFVDAGVLVDDSSAFLNGPFMHIGEPHPGGRLVFLITELPEETSHA
jgi:crossover junction endodeoxyribonuclease RusA